MAWDGLFKEAAKSGKRELTLKKEALPEKDADAIATWSDETLFKVRGLNRLQLTGFATMSVLSPLVSQLNYLQQLIMTDNGLETLPEALGELTKLLFLDASRNRLSAVPQALYKLSSLQTLQLGHNQLTGSSFPPCEDIEELFPNLQHINLVKNQLTELPEFVYKCLAVAELIASDNSITVLSEGVGKLTGLKQLDLKRNQLTVLPAEMSQCTKLKGLGFEANPLKDKRLLKVLDQFGAHRPKMVLDYLSSGSAGGGGGKGSKKGKGKGKGKGSKQKEEVEEDDESEVVFTSAKSSIRIVRPPHNLEVLVSPAARAVRPYFVCAVVRQLDLSADDALRTFFTLQTKLHETVCKRRRTATIATHDLSSMTPPLSYACAMASKIKMQPLGWKEIVPATQFISYVEKNRPDASKGGKKVYSVDAVAAQLSKYLNMVDKNQMVYVADSEHTVISLPPLSNCEQTKVTEASRDILLEVTSSTSLADAKTAMDALLVDMLKSGLYCLPQDGIAPTAATQLVVEQAKVVDGESKKLLVLYPSRIDLELPEHLASSIDVVRP